MVQPQEIVAYADINVPLPARVTSGVTTVGTTASAARIRGNLVVTTGVTVKALSANTGTIYVGGDAVSSGDGYPLAAGEFVFVPCQNLNQVSVIGSVNTDQYAWIAS